jgi:hypothetical protein
MKRKGADTGHGSGYRNLGNFPKDPMVHKMSAKGMKQPQMVRAYPDQKSTMTLKESQEILGDRATWELRNMEKALSMMPILNTPEDKKRLEAVQVMLKHRMKSSDMEHNKDMQVQEIESMLAAPKPAPNVDYPVLADMPEPPAQKESLFKRAGRGALELAKKGKQYGADYLAKQKELSRLKRQAEIETVEHPAVKDLKKQRERVNELEYQYATADEAAQKKLEKELEAERTQLREKQETVSNIKVEDLSDVELKLLAVRHKGDGFFAGMFGESNPYKSELVRRIKFKRELERQMDTIEREQDALDKAAKEGKKEGNGGFFDFLP